MKKGFSLIELSVVLIIIALIIGGILAGKSIRSTAQVQATISDLGKYKQAAISYKEKYYYWPGDDPEAGSVWQNLGGNQGDGDGVIHDCFGTDNYSSQCNNPEMFLAPQELFLAGFITGNYSGTKDFVPGINFPKSVIPRFKNVLSQATVLNTSMFAWLYDISVNKNVVTLTNLGGTRISAKSYRDAATSAANAYAIDSKIDDGQAGTGFVRGFNGFVTTCLNTSLTYDVSNSTAGCVIDFLIE